MLIETGTKLRIENCSQELIKRAIDTVSLQPGLGSLYFTARGVFQPNLQDPEQLSVYEEQCRQEGVMPLTCIHYKYDKIKGLFVPTLKQPHLVISDKLGLEKVVRALNSGGRFSLQVFDFQSEYNGSGGFTEPLETFKSRHHQHLLDSGYDLTSGNFVLKKELDEYSLGDLDLSFAQREMTLNYGHYQPSLDEDSLNVSNWFRQLAA